MKILITGGCGFLGSNLAAHAIESGHTLVVVDNLSRSGSMLNLDWLRSLGHFEFVYADMRNSNDVDRVMRTVVPEVIFHLAGQVAMTTSIADPRLDFETNALGTFNLLEAVRKHAKDATVLYSSTNKVYGDFEWVDYVEGETRYTTPAFPRGFDERVALDFHSPYGCSKGAADQYLLDYHRIFGLNTVVFRHSSMYGSRQFSTYDQGWIGWFCQQAMEISQDPSRAPFTISGNGKQVRDVLYADDMVDLYFQAATKIADIKGQVFNIGGGMENSLSLLELFAMLEQELGITLQFKRLPWRESDQKVFVADIAKAERLIGWKPKVSKESGVKNMVNWVGQNAKK